MKPDYERMSRRWCFTSYDEMPPQFIEDEMSYLCYEKEICPTTGRLHWQCYTEFKSRKRFETVLHHFKKRQYDGYKVHIECCDGTPSHNRTYCSKDYVAGSLIANFKEFGQIMKDPKPGRRTDIHYMVEMVQEGRTIGDILREVPNSLRYISHLEKAKAYLDNNKEIRDIQVYYYYGPPGTGKSHSVYEELKDQNYYVPLVQGDKIWFDCYQGEDIIWIDDVDLHTWNREFLLRLLDKYPLRLPIKGGHANAKFTKVYLTSNYDPPKEKEIRRRLTTVKCFDKSIE